MTLEICVESAAGARAAIAGGCDRIELCAALALGGLTPSAGLLASVLAVARPAGVPVHAMVRPRPGGFDYDADDLALAAAEARALVEGGAQGLVFGATGDGRLATEYLARWIETLGTERPALTLHRAIDVVDDPVAAVEQAVALGFGHILTSGGAASAMAGASVIARMAERADGRCEIIAGAGVNPGNAAALIEATGVGALHGSASVAADADVDDRFGFGPMPRRTSEDVVRQLRQVIDHKSNLGQL
ncbi:copper homeostasis protein [Sphingomonas insulae]|uniref:copper homeostasis protein CutC n=1 Tax=Sphingomonas insulae TaxID=424800 RepID=UPI002012746A|nr:copper homeostasis protein CutC [Sphingomonas insulae]NIJ29971.1 copper homeostasis protein [Sphingomonas insulae]